MASYRRACFIFLDLEERSRRDAGREERQKDAAQGAVQQVHDVPGVILTKESSMATGGETALSRQPSTATFDL